MCACVCVCVRERDRGESKKEKEDFFFYRTDMAAASCSYAKKKVSMLKVCVWVELLRSFPLLDGCVFTVLHVWVFVEQPVNGAGE